MSAKKKTSKQMLGLVVYQIQYRGSDDYWFRMGPPVASKEVARELIAVHLAIYPDAKVRVFKVLNSSEEIDVAEFLPSQSPTEGKT